MENTSKRTLSNRCGSLRASRRRVSTSAHEHTSAARNEHPLANGLSATRPPSVRANRVRRASPPRTCSDQDARPTPRWRRPARALALRWQTPRRSTPQGSTPSSACPRTPLRKPHGRTSRSRQGRHGLLADPAPRHRIAPRQRRRTPRPRRRAPSPPPRRPARSTPTRTTPPGRRTRSRHCTHPEP